MANIEIRAKDPAVAVAIAEGANAVRLRELQRRYDRLQARYGVRLYGDDIRWEKTKRRLARKYRVEPVGKVKAMLLGLVGLGVIGFENLDRYVMRGR